MRKNKNGFSLVEILMVTSIFLVVAVYLSSFFIRGLQYSQKSIPQIDRLKTARKVVGRIFDDILFSDKVYDCRSNRVNNNIIITLKKNGLALKSDGTPDENNPEPKISGYRAETRSDGLYDIYKTTYDSYDPLYPPQPTKSVLLAEKVRSYEVDFANNLYSITFTFAATEPKQQDFTIKTSAARKN